MEIILAAIVSFVVTAVVGKFLIPALVRLKAGQSIKEIGPKWHMSKQGTPTMGGLMFIIGIGVAIVICGRVHRGLRRRAGEEPRRQGPHGDHPHPRQELHHSQ